MEAFFFQRISHLVSATFLTRTCLSTLSCAMISASFAAEEIAQNREMLAVASQETARREDLLEKAKALYLEGEQLQTNQNRSAAMVKYRSALNLLPSAPATSELREVIFSRLQTASLRMAERQIEGALYQDAETTLTAVVTDARDFGFAPGVISPELKTLLQQVKSDDHFNKALTPEHLTDIQQVEEDLLLAKGHIQIGNFDQAELAYLRVLRVDSYNEAARRGLEAVERRKMQYHDVARDHTRAAMLSEVAAGWESPIPPTIGGDGLSELAPELTSSSRVVDLQQKLADIVIPSVEFADTPLASVIEFLVQRSVELDSVESDPAKKGVNIIFGRSSGENARSIPVTLKLTNVPLRVVLKYALDVAGLEYRVDPYAVTIGSEGFSEEVGYITKTFLVPPNFLRGTSSSEAAVSTDPFADIGSSAPRLVARQSAEEFLEERGIEFPEGSSAILIPQTSTLVVRNTPSNVSLIESLIFSARESGIKLVKVTMNAISISETALQELGFDSLLGQSNLLGDRVFSSGGTSGSQIPAEASDFPITSPTGQIIGENPLSGGLRFGNAASSISTIDDVINRDSVEAVTSTARSSIFGLAGVFTDPQFSLTIRALNQHESTDQLCQSSIVTLPGQRAVVRQVQEFIYPSEYNRPRIPNSGALGDDDDDSLFDFLVPTASIIIPATPEAFDTRELGEILEVEPRVSADGRVIDLSISTEITEFSGFINYGIPLPGGINELTENEILMPVFDTIKNETAVSVYDGSTVVVGGLISEGRSSVEDKVPFLGDLPGLGRLFRTQREIGVKRAILLFVSVDLLDSAARPLNQVAVD